MNLRNPFASRSGSNGGSSDSSPDSEQEPNAQEDDSPPSTGSESPPESEQSSTTQAPSPPPGVSGPETSDAAATSPTASPRTSRSSTDGARETSGGSPNTSSSEPQQVEPNPDVQPNSPPPMNEPATESATESVSAPTGVSGPGTQSTPAQSRQQDTSVNTNPDTKSNAQQSGSETQDSPPSETESGGSSVQNGLEDFKNPRESGGSERETLAWATEDVVNKLQNKLQDQYDLTTEDYNIHREVQDGNPVLVPDLTAQGKAKLGDRASERRTRALTGLGFEGAGDTLQAPNAPGQETYAQQKRSERKTRILDGLGIEPQPDSSSENAGKKDLEDAAKDLEKEAADRANDILRPLADATPKNADKTESSNSGGMFSGIEHAVTHPVETASDASDEAVDSGEAAIDTVSSALSKESLANAARGYSRFAETTSENVGEKGLLNSADALNFVQEGVDDAGFSGIAHGIGDIKHADQALTKGLTKGVIEAGNIPAVALLGSEAASAAPGAIRGGITDTLSVSEDVVTGDVGQAASDVIGGATAAGEFGAEVGGDVANAFIEHPYETTGFTVGLLGAGLVGGEAVGAARTASTAARETVVGSDLVGGTKTIPYSSITDESGALGGGSKFETSTSAPASDAVAEVSSRAVDQPSVVQEAAGGDSLLYHTTGGSLGSDLAIGEGSSELPGLFVAPDANSVGLRSTSFGATTRDFAESLKPRLPNFGGRTDRIAAFKGDAIDAMPESATGAGYEVRAADGSVVERGLSRKVAKSLAENVGDDAVVGPDRTTSGYQFLSGDAATETAYVRPTGSRTGELEAIYAPESQFTRTGESAVNVRVGGSTLNIPFTERTITYGGEKIPLDTYAPVEDLGASVEGAVETGGVSASDTTVSGSELASEYTPVSEVGESGTPVTRYQGAATGSASPTPAAPSTSSITSQPPITDSYPTGPESVFNTDVSFGRQPASDTRPPSSNEFSLPSETLQVSTGLPENSYPESSLGSTPTQEPVTSSGAPTRPPETASGGVPTAPPRDTDGFPPLDEPFTPPATPFSPPASSTPSEPGSGGPADEPAGPTGYEYPHWQESSSEDDSRRRRFDLDLGDQQLPEDEMTNRLFDQGWVNPVADAEEAFNRFVGGR